MMYFSSSIIPYIFSINFQVTITFLAISLVDAARLSGDSYWLPSNYNIVSKWRLSKLIAFMNDDIGKFGYDSRQQGRKKN